MYKYFRATYQLMYHIENSNDGYGVSIVEKKRKNCNENICYEPSGRSKCGIIICYGAKHLQIL